MLIPTRNGSSESYRYGFQGQEKDDEIKGEGNSINYKYRMHDPRVGRFFAVDPLAMEYPHYSPYSFGGNKVIESIELEGKEEYHYTLEFDDNDEPILTLISVNDFVDVNSLTSLLHTLTFGLTDAPPVNPYERHIVSSGETVDYFLDQGPYGAGYHSEEVRLIYRSRIELINGLSTIKEDLASRKDFIEKSVMVGQALSAVAQEQHIYGSGARVSSKNSKNNSNSRALVTSKPKLAQVNTRHYLNSDAIAKAKKTAPSTVGPKDIIDADLKAYNAGNFKKADGGNVEINGNIYGVKNEGSTLYPIKGESFINLTQGQIKAIQLYKTVPVDKLDKALKGAGISEQDSNFAKEFINNH